MALLSVATRKKYFKTLGLGEYNTENIKKFQKKYLRPKDVDGIYGKDTDRLLRHVYNCSLVPNFEPQEFRCPCGRCTGYPTQMKQVELKHIQSIRDHYGKPMKITSGLRCSYENSRVGGVKNSGHLTGYAVDFYMEGVTDSVPNRNKALTWIVKQPNHQFTYGANMVDSDGAYRTASGMGNAMHTETHKPKATAGSKIATKAKSYCGSATKEKASYKSDALAVYGKGNDTYCHRFVGVVLFKCGYPKMDYSGKTADAWKKIMAYLRKNFNEVSGSPKEGDIHVTRNSEGAYHIFIELGGGKKAEANSKKKYYPHTADTSKGKTNWLFRAK